MSANAPARERRVAQEAEPRDAVVRGGRGRARGDRVDPRARVPELPHRARHRDRRGVRDRDGVDHPGTAASRSASSSRGSAATASPCSRTRRSSTRCRAGGRDSRRSDFDLIRFRVDGLESITPIMYIQNGQSAVRYGSQTHGVAGARHHVRVPARRAVLRGAGPVPVRQRQRHAPASRGDRREGARRAVAAEGSARRVHPDQRRVAQGHRPARAEGRDLRPEPGQSRDDSVQHHGEPAGQSARARHPGAAHDPRFGRPREHSSDDPASAAQRAQPRQERRGRLPRADGRAAAGHVPVDPEHGHGRHGRHREHLAARRRHRHHEHHARVGHGADARDRHLQGDRREAPSHPVAVPARSAGALPARRPRGARDRLRHRRAGRGADSELSGGAHAVVGRRARARLLGRGRHRCSASCPP